MRRLQHVIVPVMLFALLTYMAFAQNRPAANMSFFITSTGPGNGANLGGLSGADKHCQSLAAAVGTGNKTWRAYLSTSGASAVNARDRIGSGPWYNFKGEMIAQNVADLHSENNKINKQTALSEKGGMINGVGDNPNRHDILTGSNTDGRASEMTCQNWTAGGEGSAATVGHHDRMGRGATGPSWNAAHQSRGCSQDLLRASGGDGLLYCFAIN